MSNQPRAREDSSGSEGGGYQKKRVKLDSEGDAAGATATGADKPGSSDAPTTESTRQNVRAKKLMAPIVADKKAPGNPKERGDRIVRLDTNFLRLHNPDEMAQVYVYEVVLDALSDNVNSLKNIQRAGADDAQKNLRRSTCFDVIIKVIKKNPELFDGRPMQTFAYDRSRVLFSAYKLSKVSPDTEIVIDRHDTTSRGSYKVTIRENHHEGATAITLAQLRDNYCNADLSKRTAGLQQFIEIVTSQGQFRNEKIVASTNGKYYSKEDAPEMIPRSGAYIARGYSKSAKIADGGIMLCVEPRVTAMYKGVELLDLLQEIGQLQDPRRFNMGKREISTLMKQLSGMNMQVKMPNRQYLFTCRGVTLMPATHVEFNFKNRETGEEKTMNVADYFANEKKEPLRYPNLPCLVEKRPGPPGKKGHNLYYPMEVCTVSKYQRVTVKQQSRQMQQDMIKKSAIHADKRKQLTERLIREELMLSRSLLLEQLHLQVAEERVTLEGRVLSTVRMEYAKRAIVSVGDRIPGKWAINNNDYYVAMALEKYMVVTVGVDRRDIDRIDREFKRTWTSQCQNRGMRVGEQVGYEQLDRSDIHTLEECFRRMKDRDVTFALFIIPPGDESKPNIKYLEAQYGIITQCVTSRLVCGPRAVGADTMSNIVNKTNMKLGGINAVISRENDNFVKMYFADDVMYVAYDVSKPPPLTNSQRRAGIVDTEPCVVGMAATTQKRKELATIDFTLQPGRHEEVVALEELIKTMLQRFKNAHGGDMPRRYVIYRDGASEGDYAVVLSNEVPRLRKAIDEMVAGTKFTDYKMTLIVCTKRHDARFFLQNIQPNAKPSQKNVLPGTCIDKVVTSAAFTEFFLCAHTAFQGTTKAIKYTVLYDTANLKLEVIQTITWMLSHCHGIITQTVSKPFVLMSAIIASQRGRSLYMTHTANCDTQSRMSAVSTSSDGRLGLDELAEQTRKLKLASHSGDAARGKPFNEHAYFA